MVKRIFKKAALALFVFIAIASPSFSLAATTTVKKPVTPAKPAVKVVPYAPLYGGWLPFWKEQSGAAEVTQNLGKLDYFSPFSYELHADVGVEDVMNVDVAPWPDLFAAARSKGVKIVPTIANFDGAFLNSLMRDPVRRRVHEEDILGTILLHNYDGIDIDYENKQVATKPYFSLFIKELSATLHANGKVLACTVEPRTPMSSRFKVTRPPVEYANDYAVLNKYCDEVRVMAYDQGNIDIKLNASKGSKAPYFPVADPDWVEKVIKESLQTISAKKLVLGVPTYGYVFQMNIADIGMNAPVSPVASADGVTDGSNLPSTFQIPVSGWTRVRSVTYAQAMQLAADNSVTPVRNASGEMSFAYSTTSPSTGLPVVRVAWFPDAASIAQHIALVKKYKLRGAYLFKFDGEGDQNFWNTLTK